MPVVTSYHYALGPAVAIATVGVLILVSRWAFGTGGSVLPKARRGTAPRDFGLLVPVAAAPTRADADRLLDLLAEHGIRATVVAVEPEAPPAAVEVLVFRADAVRARALVDVPG